MFAKEKIGAKRRVKTSRDSRYEKVGENGITKSGWREPDTRTSPFKDLSPHETVVVLMSLVPG